MDKFDMAPIAAVIAFLLSTLMIGVTVDSYRRTELLAEMVKNGVPRSKHVAL